MAGGRVVRPKSDDRGVPFSVVCALVVGGGLILCDEGLQRAKLENRTKALQKWNQTLETHLGRLEAQADNMEAGLKKCADSVPIRIQLTPEFFVDVQCSRIYTNVWGKKRK